MRKHKQTRELARLDEWARVAEQCSIGFQQCEFEVKNGNPHDKILIKMMAEHLANMLGAVDQMERVDRDYVLSFAALPDTFRAQNTVDGWRTIEFIEKLRNSDGLFEGPRASEGQGILDWIAEREKFRP